MSAEDRRGHSPSEQIQQRDHRQKLKKIKEPGAITGKVYLFDDRHHAIHDPKTGLIEINRSRSAEKETSTTSVEVKFGPAGQMDLPTAISNVLHIVDDFELTGGKVTKEDHAVLDMAELMMDWWSDTPVSEEERQEKRLQVFEVLDEANYFAAKDPRRRKMGDYLIRGTGRDSLGRLNPEAMKVLVACAIREGKRREDKNRAIFVKYGLQLLPDLVMQREEERKRIGEVVVAIDDILSIHPKSLDRYVSRLNNLRKKKIPDKLNPFIIKTAPLVFPAAEVLAQVGEELFDSKLRRIALILGHQKLEAIASSSRTNNWNQMTRALNAGVILKPIRDFTDPVLQSVRDQLGEALATEQVKMDEEMEKRSIRLANRT